MTDKPLRVYYRYLGNPDSIEVVVASGIADAAKVAGHGPAIITSKYTTSTHLEDLKAAAASGRGVWRRTKGVWEKLCVKRRKVRSKFRNRCVDQADASGR